MNEVVTQNVVKAIVKAQCDQDWLLSQAWFETVEAHYGEAERVRVAGLVNLYN